MLAGNRFADQKSGEISTLVYLIETPEVLCLIKEYSRLPLNETNHAMTRSSKTTSKSTIYYKEEFNILLKK